MMRKIKDNTISILNNGWIIEVIIKEDNENNRGNKINNIITADLGNWIVDMINENALIRGAVNP